MAVIRRNQSSLSDKPSVTKSSMARSTSIKALGVSIWEKVSPCSIRTHKPSYASIFALKTLKNHGASIDSLQLITRATIIARTKHASPAWWGLADKRDKSCLEPLLNSLTRSGYVHPNSTSTVELANEAETSLFKAVLCNEKKTFT